MRRFQAIGALILMSGGLLALGGCEKAVSKATPSPPTVTVARPIVRDVQDFDEYTGKFAAVESVDVRARVKGYLDSIGFKDGDEVRAGQVLFQIDPRPFKAAVDAAEGQLGVVKARKVKAEADVKRYKDLVPKGAATAQDLDKAIGELGEAEAGIQAAKAQLEQANLDLNYSTIKAPINGRASRAILTVGNLIAPASGGDQLLTTIVSVDPIQIYFDVDQRAAQEYQRQARGRAGAPETRPARELNIPFQFGLASEEGFPHEGVIDFIDNKVDPETGTIMLRGEVNNARRLFAPGYFARVRVPVGDKYRAILVSERAIGTQQGQKYVLVVDSKNTVAFRPVQLGALQPDGLQVITSGVNADDRIVVNGMQRARPGLAVNAEAGAMPFVPTTRPATTQPVAVVPIKVR